MRRNVINDKPATETVAAHVLRTPKPGPPGAPVYEPESLEEVMRIVAGAAMEKLAGGLRVIDVREVADFTDFVVVCQGQTPLQNRAIADRIIEALKEYDIILSSLSGYRTADWVLVDFDSFVVHVFLPEVHGFYQLEELYSGGRELLLD